jgi:hypothetical protein
MTLAPIQIRHRPFRVRIEPAIAPPRDPVRDRAEEQQRDVFQ